MKKFIILIALFYILEPSYGLSFDSLKPPCSNLWSHKRKSPDRMIQALMEYSGETRDAPWIQELIQHTEKRTRVNYPDSTEMHAILKLLEEKTGNKSQLLKALKSSPRFLSQLREESLNTHLNPLFKTLEDIFGQEVVSNRLQKSLQIIELKSDRVKQIADLLKGLIPIPIFDNQRTFTIQLNFKDEELKNLFITNPAVYKITLETAIGSNSPKIEEYQKGIIQILWPFIKSFISENLKLEAKNTLHSESKINEKTIEAIKELFSKSSLNFNFKPKVLEGLFKVLTGKEKLSLKLNNEIIQLNLKLTNHEIGQLILKYKQTFLRNNKKKLKSNIKILWPFLIALKRKNFESQKDKFMTEKNIEDETAIIIKRVFIQSPQGFATKPKLLNELIKILTGEKEISFQYDNQIITLKLNFEDHKIGELFQKNSNAFLQNPERLESNIKILYPLIKAFVQKNLNSQKDSNTSQENIESKTVRTIKQAILQSFTGLSMQSKVLKNFIEALRGKKEISFQYDNQIITLKLNIEDHKIAESFLNDPQGFSRMNQKKLESTIEVLWPFIKAFVQKNLNSQKDSNISQESVNSETVRTIEQVMLQSIQGFSAKLEPLKNLIKILKGEKEISFLFNGKIITLRLILKADEIGELFIGNPHGFSNRGKKLENVFQNLWPFLKKYFELQERATLTTTEEENKLNQSNPLKYIIRKAFFTSPPNLKWRNRYPLLPQR